MIPHIREKYNSEFSEKKYKSFLHDLDSEFNYHIEFRVAETPVFLPKDFKNEVLKASDEILASIDSDEYKKYSEKSLPDEYAVPGEDSHSSLLSIDYAICKDDNGNLIPQLIELQGFASLYCYQQFLNLSFRKNFNIDGNFTNYFGGLDEISYVEELKKFFLGDSSPDNVILLEIEPEKQKTYIDFLCTEKYLGIKSVCLTKVIKEGNKLFYDNNGKKTLIERIYNRVINDELVKRTDIKYNFRFQDELDVKWIAHPNWFFKLSKYTLPFLKSKYVPDSEFLDRIDRYPDDLENYVLKPLFSFAGAGVLFDVNKKDLDSVKNRSDYILQKKIKYEPVILTPDSPAKAELRLLYIRDDKPRLVNNLVRLSKGKMMGVDFNKEKTWVGSSIAYYEK